jgi:hypothetical protein
MLKDFIVKSGIIGGAVVGAVWLGVWGFKKVFKGSSDSTDNKADKKAA